jgi:hypothetical protein
MLATTNPHTRKDLMTPHLYGSPTHHEHLALTLDQAITEYHKTIAHLNNWPIEITISTYNVLPPGESGNNTVMTADEIIKHIIDNFGDDCGDENLWDNYQELRNDPEVLAAFNHARTVLISKQTYPMADSVIGTTTVTLYQDGHYDISDPS